MSSPRRAVVDRAIGGAPSVVAIGLTAWVALPFVRLDRWVTGFDTVAYSGPNLVVSLEEIRSGRIPQWNSAIFGGVTHIGNAPAAVFEPLMWMLSPLPAHRALVWVIAGHLVILALGMWWLLRRTLRLTAPASALGTIAVVGSGLVMSRSIQFEQIAVVAWVPWVLVGCDLALRPDGGRRQLALLPVVAALLATAGHPQQVYIAAPLVALWSAARLLDHGAGWRGVARLGACGVLALLIASAQLLPIALALDESAIDERSIEAVANPAYSARPKLLTATVLGDVTADTHPFTSGSFEAMAFVGAMAGALALLGALAGWQHGRRWTILAMIGAAGFGLVCSLGPRTFVYRALFRVAPGFDLARVPGRWMLLVTVATAVLGAIGLDRVQSGEVSRRKIVLGGALLATVVLTTWIGPFVESSRAGLMWWIVAFAIVIGLAALATRREAVRWGVAVAMVAIAALELAVMSDHSLARGLQATAPITELGDEVTDFLRREPGRSLALTDDRLGEPDYLVPALRPNTNAAVDVASLDGYDGGTQVTMRWVEATSALANEPFNAELTLRAQLRTPVSPQVAARLGVRWLLVDTTTRVLDDVAPEWDGPVRRSGALVLLENPHWRSEASVLHRFTVAPTRAPADVLRTAAADTVVLESGALRQRCTSDCAPTPASVDRPHPGAIDVRLPSGASDGILVVDEQLSGGWRAAVDGVDTPLVEANGMFIGVPVPAGAEQVQLRFTAPGLRPGLVASTFGLFLITTLAVPASWLRRRRPHEAAAISES